VSKDLTIIIRTHRESGAQPTPLGETLGADGPDTDVSTPRGHSPERVDWGGIGKTDGSSTRSTVNEQPSGPSVTAGTSDDSAMHREPGAQPTPLEETLGATGPDTQPGDVSTPHGHGPERFDWRVDLRDNIYKYESLREPEGPAEKTRGRDAATPYGAPIDQDPKHGRPPMRWLDELLGSGWGLGMGHQTPREDVSHHNFWDRAEVQPYVTHRSACMTVGVNACPKHSWRN